jgi:hypothetical protein
VDRGQRIEMIKESATLLAKREWPELDLILDQWGLPTGNLWQGEEKLDYSIRMIKVATDEALVDLHRYLTGESVDAAGPQPWQQGRFKLFMSHLAIHEKLVGQIGHNLAPLGIDAFVAHDSIEPSLEWQTVIETALRACDAMVVFLHEGFHESSWCDQEVGFALARRVPLLPLNYGVNPYGFMGKFQADRCSSRSEWEVANRIVEWLITTPAAQAAMSEALVWALENSYSYNLTRRIMPLLQRMSSYTPAQLERLDRAARSNGEVKDAVLGPHQVPTLVRALIAERGGLPVPASDPWASSSEPPF